MKRVTARVVFSGILFAMWVMCAVFVVRDDLAHEKFGVWTIVVLIVSGFLTFMRLLRAWFNEPRSD